MTKKMDWADYINYFDDDTNANDWLNEIMPHIMFKLFRDQENYLFMAGELGKGRWPMLKENAVEYIEDIINREFDWLIESIAMAIIRKYHEDDIDMPQSIADEYNEWYGFSEKDEGYIEGKDY